MNSVKNSIGWADFTVNPVKGICPRFKLCLDNQGKPYCYAGKGYNRNLNETFKDKRIRYDDSVWGSYNKAKSGSRVFIGSTIDLFHEKTIQYFPEILKHLRSDLINIFLTKCPENLPKEFPDNCYVGVSATNWMQFSNAIGYLAPIQLKVRVKFISFEPLLERIQFDMMQEMLFQSTINWVIIGTQTPYSVKTAPKIEWLKEIVEAADKSNMPVFLKNKLYRHLFTYPVPKSNMMFFKFDKGEFKLRQEFPAIK